MTRIKLAHLVDAVQRLWVGRLPRKSPDKVVEHRISLSNLERDYVKKYLQTQRVQSFTQLSTGAGVAALGVGAVAGIYVLSRWLGVGDILENIKQTPTRLVAAAKLLLSDQAILYYVTRFPAAANLLRQLKERVRQEYEEYRTKRSQLEAEFAKFGDPASSYYDPQEAARIEAEVSALDEEWAQTQQRANEALDAIVAQVRDNVPFL